MMEINLLLKSSIILGLGWLILILVKKSTPGFRFNIWKIAFLLLLVLPFFQFRPALTWQPVSNWAPTTAFSTTPHDSPSLLLSKPHSNVAPIPKLSPEQNQKTTINWLHLIWLTGMIGMLLHLLFESGSLFLLKRSKQPILQNWREVLNKIQTTKDNKQQIRLIAQQNLSNVFTFGVFHPVIVLPIQAQNWTDDQLEAVLLHELAHIERKDFLFNILIQIVKAIYWFNPLVWIVGNRMRLEAELASDQLVLTSGFSSLSYANHLLTSAKLLNVQPSFANSLSCSITNGSAIKKRMSEILTPSRQTTFSKPRRLLISLSLITLGGLFSGLSIEPIQLEGLYHSDMETRISTIKALNQNEYLKTSSSILKPLLKDTNYQIRKEALLAIGRLGSSSTFYDAKRHRTDNHPEVRAASLYALFEISCLPAYREIVEAQQDPNPEVRALASSYLYQFNRRKLVRWLKAGLQNEGKQQEWIIDQFIAIKKAGNQEALVSLLAGQNPALERQLHQVIDQIDQPDAFRKLRKLL